MYGHQKLWEDHDKFSEVKTKVQILPENSSLNGGCLIFIFTHKLVWEKNHAVQFWSRQSNVSSQTPESENFPHHLWGLTGIF